MTLRRTRRKETAWVVRVDVHYIRPDGFRGSKCDAHRFETRSDAECVRNQWIKNGYDAEVRRRGPARTRHSGGTVTIQLSVAGEIGLFGLLRAYYEIRRAE